MRKTTRPADGAAVRHTRVCEAPPQTAGDNVVRLPETGFLRQRQVLAFVPISKSTLWRRVQARSFPEPIKLSARVTAWRAEDVRRWIDEQGMPA